MNLLHRLDYNLAKPVQKLPKSYKPALSLISFSGEPVVVLGTAAIGFMTAFNRGDIAVQKAFVLCGLAYGLNTMLKQSLRRRRPHNLRMTTLGIKSYSFPSGHAFGAMIFYGLLAYLAFTGLRQPLGAISAVMLGLLIFLIGLSRVYLKTHYPSDVIAGWLLGGLSLLVIIYLLF